MATRLWDRAPVSETPALTQKGVTSAEAHQPDRSAGHNARRNRPRTPSIPIALSTMSLDERSRWR